MGFLLLEQKCYRFSYRVVALACSFDNKKKPTSISASELPLLISSILEETKTNYTLPTGGLSGMITPRFTQYSCRFLNARSFAATALHASEQYFFVMFLRIKLLLVPMSPRNDSGV
jgi:hypothetical protein